MEENKESVIVCRMETRQKHFTDRSTSQAVKQKQRYRLPVILSAAFVFAVGGAWIVHHAPETNAVMSHVTAGFEYDDSLGRLQFVSNILPESAMVFIQSGYQEEAFTRPVNAELMHAWSPEEPWLEYSGGGEMCASADGEIMTVVSDRRGKYTVRIMHDSGYETVYSGLANVEVHEGSLVSSGQRIGTAVSGAAYELRKDGMSIQPVFAGSILP